MRSKVHHDSFDSVAISDDVGVVVRDQLERAFAERGYVALLGSTIVLGPRPEVKALVDLIEAHRVTTFFGVPTFR